LKATTHQRCPSGSRPADTVVVLDLPAHTCLLGIAERRLRHGAGQHQDAGIYNRITWNFIRYIVTYRRAMLPRVHQLISDHATRADVIVLRRRADTRAFLRDVAARAQA
jgi:hypothetical protein